MSYRISVNLNEPLVHYKNSSSSNTREIGLLTLIGRFICSRRFRPLKLYMATFVILVCLLFLFFKPFSTSTEATHGEETSHQSFKAQQTLAQEQSIHHLDEVSNNPLVIDRHNEQMQPPQEDKSQSFPTEHVSTSKHSYRYSTNFSYTLSMSDFAQTNNINDMQSKIREAAKHSWDNYRRYAWGFDMLKPRSRAPDHWFDLGLTIVDGADTLIMMGLTHESNQALDWMENELNFNSRNENSNCFELTIRILAGLLSAYHLTGREKLKHKAIEFGDILLHCYDTESRIIPYSDIDLATQRAHPPAWNPYSSLSEVTSLQIEYRFLSQISGNPIYEQTSFQTNVHIHNLTSSRAQKLLPMYINPTNGQLEDSVITLGARSDSYYEYLLKQYLQTGIKWLEDDYLDCMDEVRDKLFKHTDGAENYTYVAEMQIFKSQNNTDDLKFYNKMDHLVCFLPGTLALGFYHFSPEAAEYRLKYNLETPNEKLNNRYNGHLDMAKALGRTCYHMYNNMGTGLSPEIASFVHSSTNDPIMQNQPELQVQTASAHNILRPEFVESLFYLYHITGLSVYRSQASQIFEAFQKYSRISSGYSSISDVRLKPTSNADLDEALHRHAPDRMESFWLSETLKYLYLVFCDDKHIVGTLLNNYVFNTEAHMVPLV